MEKEGFHMGVGLSDETDVLRGLKKSAQAEKSGRESKMK